MSKASNSGELARYSCQIWRRHFANADWFQELEDAAFEALLGRVFEVRSFWPETSLGEVQCEIRPLTDEEAKSNGRTFARETYVCLDFVLKNANKTELRKQLLEQNDHLDRIDVDELVEYAIASELESFCDVIMFLVNVTFCGVFGLESATVSVSGDILVHSHAGQVRLPRSGDEYGFLAEGVRQQVTLDQTLNWSLSCSGIWAGGAKASVEKAMSFLSHAFHGSARDEVAVLLWSTAGLEAIACDNSNSIRNQLKRRLPLLFDLIPFVAVGKTVSDGYDFRSRLFHGDIPTINSFVPDVVGWSEERYDYKVADYSLAFQLMLIAIIWKSILFGANEIVFRETAHFHNTGEIE